jgi:hypothetical protein
MSDHSQQALEINHFPAKTAIYAHGAESTRLFAGPYPQSLSRAIQVPRSFSRGDDYAVLERKGDELKSFWNHVELLRFIEHG